MTRVGTLGEDERCRRCDGENVIWAAPSPLWNLVMRGNDINAETIYADLVCIRCFIVMAEEAGVQGRWRVYVNPDPEGLIHTTPSGRVWDPERWLWVEPDAAQEGERGGAEVAAAVEDDFIDTARRILYQQGEGEIHRSSLGRVYDWLAGALAKHDAEVRAGVLREAADEMGRVFLRLPRTPSPIGDYVQRQMLAWRAEADRIAGDQ